MALLGDLPVASFDSYLRDHGGEALETALELAPEDVVDEVANAGLRGRGGAGFPTGTKWASVRQAAADSRAWLVCNAAEGEPGTAKDRALITANPYQLVEGILIALHALQAEEAYIGIKAAFTEPIERLDDALLGARTAGWPGADRVHLVPGPDEYLFGEEKAMLEVIEGKLPLPRILPPYMQGLYATVTDPNPTAVNNVETLAHVTHILRDGALQWRSVGTAEAPGTMVFTVTGDCTTPGMFELPMGTPLRTLVCDLAGADEIQAIFSGVSNAVITPELLDLPLDFDSFAEAGTGLGSGGFMVYGPHRDLVQVTATLAEFLAIESCGQCNACALGTAAMADHLHRLVEGVGTEGDLQEIRSRLDTVTAANRCYLPVGAQLTIGSMLEEFGTAFADHVGVAADPDVAVVTPKIVELGDGQVVYDRHYARKRRDWSYTDAQGDAALPPGLAQGPKGLTQG
ncbi:MAG: NADH-quinone oxidoreductase subunit F [Actinobacteria bacterium]|nr:NADH-quinone oxidoreductase subunit F [Actinomycetota bacterium]